MILFTSVVYYLHQQYSVKHLNLNRQQVGHLLQPGVCASEKCPKKAKKKRKKGSTRERRARIWKLPLLCPLPVPFVPAWPGKVSGQGPQGTNQKVSRYCCLLLLGISTCQFIRKQMFYLLFASVLSLSSQSTVCCQSGLCVYLTKAIPISIFALHRKFLIVLFFSYQTRRTECERLSGAP